MVDIDLAVLYGTETKKLKQQVKRNRKRFPPDFMFALNVKEKSELVTNCDFFLFRPDFSSRIKKSEIFTKFL